MSFSGLVRSDPRDPIVSLTLECYPELARDQIGRIEAQAVARFGLLRVTVIHRYGRLTPGDPIVQVMTLAPHRAAAFEAAEFLMDYLKTDAPFWKKEETATGARWVEHNPDDERAQRRWSDATA